MEKSKRSRLHHYPEPRPRSTFKIVLIGLFFTTFAAALGIAGFYKIVLYNAQAVDVENLPLDKKIHIIIPRGANLYDIAQILEESGVIDNAQFFVYAAKYLQYEKHLKAGQYLLPLHTSNQQVLDILRSSKPQNIRVTIPEGRDLRFIISAFTAKLPLDRDKFLAAVRDTALCREMGIPDTSLFGYMMPNTYFFDPGIDEREIVRTMVREFKVFFDDELLRRADLLRMTVRQVVTLASIVEGETADDDERFIVSAVYHNRLKHSMYLQADPTVQYILSDGPRRLYNKDLEIDSPYNTYRYRGLPPGPINNPGKQSILAALYPAKTDYLYMVANGKGQHIFSTSLEEHLRARQPLDKLRKELEKKK